MYCIMSVYAGLHSSEYKELCKKCELSAQENVSTLQYKTQFVRQILWYIVLKVNFVFYSFLVCYVV